MVIFVSYGPVDKVGVLGVGIEEKFFFRRVGGVVETSGMSIKGVRVDLAVATISCQYFGERTHVVIAYKQCHNIFVTIGNDDVVVSVGRHPVLDLSWTRVDTRLWAIGTGGLVLCISILCFLFGLLCC